MLEHHDLLRALQTRWQESSAGTAVSGDSIPIDGNLSPVANDGKTGWFRSGAGIKPEARRIMRKANLTAPLNPHGEEARKRRLEP